MTPLLVSLGFALLLAVVVAIHYRRRSPSPAPDDATLTDDMIRRIEEEGRLALENSEPLDLDEIREQEEQFWEESWDEPDEW